MALAPIGGCSRSARLQSNVSDDAVQVNTKISQVMPSKASLKAPISVNRLFAVSYESKVFWHFAAFSPFFLASNRHLAGERDFGRQPVPSRPSTCVTLA